MSHIIKIPIEDIIITKGYFLIAGDAINEDPSRLGEAMTDRITAQAQMLVGHPAAERTDPHPREDHQEG
ncbi:MAG: hypothetical protein ABIC95_02075 [archaeon]